MKVTSLYSLSLVGLAASSPLASRQDAAKHAYPIKSASKGFNLIVNVTDSSLDFEPSINNFFITTIHTGAGLNLVGVNNETGPVFYQNGTLDEWIDGKATILFDGGTPSTPAGLKLNEDKDQADVSTASLNFGPGTPGVQLPPDAYKYTFVLPETYLACKQNLDYYQGKEFIIIKNSKNVKADGDYKKEDVPENCVPIRLVPECAKLEDLAPGAFASHDFALPSQCYKDVSKIEWAEYGPQLRGKKCRKTKKRSNRN